MTLKRFAIGFCVLAVLLMGGLWLSGRFSTDGRPDGAAVAEANTDVSETAVKTVMAEAMVVPLRHADLSFQIGGPVTEILVEEWDEVTAGQALMQVDAADLEASLAQAEAGLEQAEVALLAADTHIQTAQAGVQAAEVGVLAAQAQLVLTAAEPLTQEIASLQANISAAEASIAQAAAGRDVALQGATQAQIQAAQAQVASASAEERMLQEQYDQIIKAGVGGPPEEHTRYALHAAETALAAAEASLTELQSGPTYAESRSAGAAIAVAEAQQDAAEAQLALLLAGPRPEQIAIAEVAVQQAQVSVEQARAAVAETEAGREQAAAAVTQAQAVRDAAAAALEKATLRAPFDGTVAQIEVELGQVFSPGVPVLVLADMSEWQVETTDMTELNVVEVATGEAVRVELDAFAEVELDGTITNIAAVSGTNRGDITYAVTVTFNQQPDLPLRWGMTAVVIADISD